MNVKHLAFAGIVVLVVLGFVAVAGCTSESQTADRDPVVGTWVMDFSKMTDATAELFPSISKVIGKAGDSLADILTLAKITVKLESDGNGKVLVSIAGFSAGETDVTWVREDSGSYRMNLFDSDIIFNLDAASGILSDESGIVTLNKQE